MEHTCEFCGQVLAVIADSPEEAQEEALRTCDCPEASRQRAIQRAHEGVDQLFGADEDYMPSAMTVAAIKDLCVLVIDGVIGNVGVSLGWGLSASIKKTGKGEIKLCKRSARSEEVTV